MDDLFPRVWALPLPSPNHKCLMLALARYSLKSGVCWASVAVLAKEICATERSVHRWLKQLEQEGYIVRKARRRSNGSSTTSYTWLRLPAMSIPALEPPERQDRNRDVLMAEEIDDEVSEFPTEPPAPKSPNPDRVAPTRSEPKSPLEDEEIHEDDSSMSNADASDADVLFEELKEETLPDRESDLVAEQADAVFETIWNAASDHCRKRSTKEKTREALRKAIRRGDASASEIAAAWVAFTRSEGGTKQGGLFQKAIHLWLRDGLYEGWVEEQKSAPAASSGPPTSRELGTMEEPTELAQRLWMKGYERGRRWREDYGPEPGEKGCRVTPAIQREFGWTPHAEEAS